MSKTPADEPTSPLNMTGSKGLRLYSTLGCHLCDEAIEVIRTTCPELLAELDVVDIAEDSDLMDAYDVRIPVLQVIESGSELGWPFGPEDLRTFVRPNHGRALDRCP